MEKIERKKCVIYISKVHARGGEVIFRITNGSAFFCTRDIHPKCKWFYIDFKSCCVTG